MSLIGFQHLHNPMPHFETTQSFPSRPVSSTYTPRPSRRQSKSELPSGWSNQALPPQARPPTPPLDMNTAAHHAPQYDYRGSRHHEDPAYGQRNPPMNYTSSSISHSSNVNQMSSGRPLTPYSQNHDQSRQPEQPSLAKSSSNNSIAPFLQIPRSINNSGGSLSELAAQVRFVLVSVEFFVLTFVD